MSHGGERSQEEVGDGVTVEWLREVTLCVEARSQADGDDDHHQRRPMMRVPFEALAPFNRLRLAQPSAVTRGTAIEVT